MWFGYMNRNFEEELDVPAGADNKFEPGPADRGQPTHFDTRRHKDVFRVVVPKDFGDTNKLVWTVTVRGKRGVDYRHVEPRLADRSRSHDAWRQQPEHRLEPLRRPSPCSRTTLSIAQGARPNSVSATDDGLPKRQGETVGMTVEWEKYRGPGPVTFSQIKQPLEGREGGGHATFQ